MMSGLIPLPSLPIVVRAGTPADLGFIDALQKQHRRQVGWMPMQSLEGKIAAGQVLVAEQRHEGESRHEGTQASRHEGESRHKGTQAQRHEGESRHEGEGLPSVPSCLDASVPARRDASVPTPLGYLIASDRYFKRDDVGIIYQLNVVPGRQRGLIGATLLKAQFERSAYGCRLYCCWCAQDIAANRFWEAMGFVPLAFRTGSRHKGTKARRHEGENRHEGTQALRHEGESRHEGEGLPSVPSCLNASVPSPRVHIFWQRRIRAGDTATPWWFPSQTTGGSIREDRLVLPIPPGTHWSDAKPIVLPGMACDRAQEIEPRTQKRLTQTRSRSTRTTAVEAANQRAIGGGGMRFGAATTEPAKETARTPKPEREPRKKQKNDPQLVAAARELRDRWLEHVNEAGVDANPGKYEVSRVIEGEATLGRSLSLPQTAPLLAA